MSFKLLGGGSDLNTIVSDVNQNILELKNKEVTEVFKDGTGTPRVLLGEGANGFYGLKVSKPGFDVYSAANANLVFNSSQNAFKIVLSGTLSWVTTAGNDNQSLTIPHNLGYTPIALVFVGDSSFSYPLPYTTQSLSSGGGLNSFQTITTLSSFIDNTNLYVSQNRSVFYMNATGQTSAGSISTHTWPIRYYLLQETAV